MYAHEIPFHDRLRECFAIIGGRETATPKRCADGAVVVGYTVPVTSATGMKDIELYAECALQHPITSDDAHTATCTTLRCNLVHTPTQAIVRRVHVPLGDDETLPIDITPERVVTIVNTSLMSAV